MGGGGGVRATDDELIPPHPPFPSPTPPHLEPRARRWMQDRHGLIVTSRNASKVPSSEQGWRKDGRPVTNGLVPAPLSTSTEPATPSQLARDRARPMSDWCSLPLHPEASAMSLEAGTPWGERGDGSPANVKARKVRPHPSLRLPLATTERGLFPLASDTPQTDAGKSQSKDSLGLKAVDGRGGWEGGWWVGAGWRPRRSADEPAGRTQCDRRTPADLVSHAVRSGWPLHISLLENRAARCSCTGFMRKKRGVSRARDGLS